MPLPIRNPGGVQAVYQKRGDLLLLTDRHEAVKRVEQQLEEARCAQQAAGDSQQGRQ